MKVIIIDDEYYALRNLKSKLEKIPGVEVVAMYEDPAIALDELSNTQPDLAFLDIEMPETDGITLLGMMFKKRPDMDFVFTSAYHAYVTETLETKALDFLVKPVKFEQLYVTLEKIKKIRTKSSIGHKIEVKCFGDFAVSIDGKMIDEHWRTKKTEELFAYLLCMNGKSVSRERIINDLWPELSMEKGYANLYTTQYYLKKRLNTFGIQHVLKSRLGNISLNLEDMKLDLLDFDHFSERYNEDKSKMEMLEQMVELYRGLLLENKPYSWTLSIQQPYEVKFENALNSLIQFYSERGDEKTAEYYEMKKMF
ncbi:two-component SAPR family response regulator [Paenibacillus amylolyticus]|uniref:Two-component SAPR family response regulator n=1 Tax=Paenibacillus amylolyticus TaxID=1451 RepID=A0AAP5H2W6_PAEAM|nr:response regulator [Paenibacillus amylolyticus]MDR6724887.1 two-component SAPR family response regulator [Paenibacillus amylolyticus]